MTPILHALLHPPLRPPPPITLENDPVHPAQFFTVNPHTLSPAKRLLWALLTDAWETATRPTSTRDVGRKYYPLRTPTVQADARAWINSDAAWYPHAFENVCAHLGLDPSAIRRALGRALAHETPPRPAVIDPRRQGHPSRGGRCAGDRDVILPDSKILGYRRGYILLRLADGREARLAAYCLKRHSPVKYVGDTGDAIISYRTAKIRGLLPDAAPAVGARRAVPTERGS